MKQMLFDWNEPVWEPTGFRVCVPEVPVKPAPVIIPAPKRREPNWWNLDLETLRWWASNARWNQEECIKRANETMEVDPKVGADWVTLAKYYKEVAMAQEARVHVLEGGN